MDRQLYPDTLRAIALGRIVLFHFFGWKLLTYFPSIGVMFALGGWFAATSFNRDSMLVVLARRFERLLPAWWVFAAVMLLAGFFYARGAGVELGASQAWLLPLERATWKLDTDVAANSIVITWYIAAYIWLLLLTPLLLNIYRYLSWLVVVGPLAALLVYAYFGFHEVVTPRDEVIFNLLTYGSCWTLGFAKADGKLDALPKAVPYLAATLLSACGIYLTYKEGALASNPIGLALMSFGVSMLLLSFNPTLSALPRWVKGLVAAINGAAVTIYLFHNAIINASFEIAGHFGAYELGERYGTAAGFVITLALLAVLAKTIGRVEQVRWLPAFISQPKIRHGQAALTR